MEEITDTLALGLLISLLLLGTYFLGRYHGSSLRPRPVPQVREDDGW